MVSESFIRYLETLLFPVKLYKLAESEEIKSIIWSRGGTSVKLNTEILPTECFVEGIFNVADCKHVFRQLSYYGFHRISRTSQVWEFEHPSFRADRFDLVQAIKRPSKKKNNVDIKDILPFVERRKSTRLQKVVTPKKEKYDYSSVGIAVPKIEIKDELDALESRKTPRISKGRKRKRGSSYQRNNNRNKRIKQENASNETQFERSRSGKDFNVLLQLKDSKVNSKPATRNKRKNSNNKIQNPDVTYSLRTRSRSRVIQFNTDPSHHATLDVKPKNFFKVESFTSERIPYGNHNFISDSNETFRNSSTSCSKSKYNQLESHNHHNVQGMNRDLLRKNKHNSDSLYNKEPDISYRKEIKSDLKPINSIKESTCNRRSNYEERHISQLTLENINAVNLRIKAEENFADFEKLNNICLDNRNKSTTSNIKQASEKFVLGKFYKWTSIGDETNEEDIERKDIYKSQEHLSHKDNFDQRINLVGQYSLGQPKANSNRIHLPKVTESQVNCDGKNLTSNDSKYDFSFKISPLTVNQNAETFHQSSISSYFSRSVSKKASNNLNSSFTENKLRIEPEQLRTKGRPSITKVCALNSGYHDVYLKNKSDVPSNLPSRLKSKCESNSYQLKKAKASATCSSSANTSDSVEKVKKDCRNKFKKSFKSIKCAEPQNSGAANRLFLNNTLSSLPRENNVPSVTDNEKQVNTSQSVNKHSYQLSSFESRVKKVNPVQSRTGQNNKLEPNHYRANDTTSKHISDPMLGEYDTTDDDDATSRDNNKIAVTCEEALNDDVNLELSVSSEKRQKLVEYLYLQVKLEKMTAWDVLESPDPLIRHCAYDALTLDVEKIICNMKRCLF